MFHDRNNDPDVPGDEFARTHRYKYYRDGRFHDLYEDPLEESPLPVDGLDDKQKEMRNILSGIINE